MKLNKIIPGLMITTSSLVGCEPVASYKSQKILDSLMANKPAKEYLSIQAGWRKGCAIDADVQHSIDSVAFRNILDSSKIKDSAIVKKFNNLINQTKLKNAENYKSAFEEIDNKMIEQGITTAKHKNNLTEYRELKHWTSSWPKGSYSYPDDRAIMRLRQFNLDSITIRKIFEKDSTNLKEFEKTTSKIKPRDKYDKFGHPLP